MQLKGDPDMLHFKYSYDSDYKRCKYRTTKQGMLKWTGQQRGKNV